MNRISGAILLMTFISCVSFAADSEKEIVTPPDYEKIAEGFKSRAKFLNDEATKLGVTKDDGVMQKVHKLITYAATYTSYDDQMTKHLKAKATTQKELNSLNKNKPKNASETKSQQAKIAELKLSLISEDADLAVIAANGKNYETQIAADTMLDNNFRNAFRGGASQFNGH